MTSHFLELETDRRASLVLVHSDTLNNNPYRPAPMAAKKTKRTNNNKVFACEACRCVGSMPGQR
jgi:hypothetical protein